MPRTLDITTAENVVQSTKNYKQFKLMGQNRLLSQGHIESIKKAFTEIGNLTRVQPILVNERYEIIDGQHRFVAAQQMSEPIYFTMQHGLRIRDARNMNILHRTWSMDDFARSYAEGGNSNYIRYLELQTNYEVTHSVLLAYIYFVDRKGTFKLFRLGDLEIADLAGTRERLEKLVEAREAVPHLKNDRTFALAYLKVMESEHFNQARMVRKLAAIGDKVVRHFATQGDYLRALEEVFNYDMSESRRVRLY